MDFELSPEEQQVEVTETVSIPRAVVLLVNTITGLSLLSVGYCFRCGVILNTVLCACLGLLSLLSFYMLNRTSTMVGAHSYEDLISSAISPKWRMLPNVIVIVILMGIGVLYCQYAGSILGSALEDFGVKALSSRELRILIPLVCVIMPLIFLPSISLLSKASMLSLVFVFIYMIHSLVYCIKDGKLNSSEMKYSEFGTIFFGALDIQSTAFCCHPNIFSVLDTLTQPTLKRRNTTMTLVVITAVILYVFIGVTGYLTLFDRIDGQVVLSYYPNGRLFTQIIRVLYTLLLSFNTPNVLWACRETINSVFFNSEMTTLRFNLIGFAMVVVIGLIAIFIKNIGTIFSIIGGVCSPIIVYIFPSLFYLRINKDAHIIVKILVCIYAVIGLGFIGFSLWNQFK